ncbi:MAG: hypothetical protein HYS13_22460 [Planctomycetia bacterium]|nr:hypothetical protein [Planctomycetia bacterium]
MASIDSSYVKRELKAIAATSQLVKKLLQETFEALERDPSSFPLLDVVPEHVRQGYPTAQLRKAYLESGKHSFRLIFIHWTFPDSDREDHVDIVYAFPRRKGYPIDWDDVEDFLKDA